jgi:RHS repeat-associated protein
MYTDLDGDGIPHGAGEIIQENHYYPFGMLLAGPWRQASSTSEATAYRYNSIEHVDDYDLGVDMAFYRTLDPAVGRWWQVDPKAEATMGLTPYGSMNSSPMVYKDPKGDIALTPIIIGVATHTLSHLERNDWTFNNWNWGSLIAVTFSSVMTSGTSSSLASANIGGFVAGTITGAVGGYTNAVVSSAFTRTNGKAVLKDIGIGASIGGLTQGIAAVADGRNFITGLKSTVYKSPVSDNYGKQNGECVLRCLEEIAESYGMTKEDFKYWLKQNGGTLGVAPKDVDNLINGSGALKSKRIVINPYDRGDIAGIRKAFMNNERVMVGFTTRTGGGHAVLVRRIKVWSSGRYRLWFAETSPVRLAPHSSSNLARSLPGGPIFWSVY